jgi:hypothetical protein
MYTAAARRHTRAVQEGKAMQGHVDNWRFAQQQKETLKAAADLAAAGAELAHALLLLSLARGKLELCLRGDDVSMSQGARVKVWQMQQERYQGAGGMGPNAELLLTQIAWCTQYSSEGSQQDLSSSSDTRPWSQRPQQVLGGGPETVGMPKVLMEGLRAPTENQLPPALVVAAAEGKVPPPFTAIETVYRWVRKGGCMQHTLE